MIAHFKKNRIETTLLILTILIPIYLIFSLLIDNESYFVHLEYYANFARCALREGPNLALSDLKAFFNHCFDGGASRPRFYTWFVWSIDTKLRLYLFNYIPFYPLLSLTWLFTFTLLPFYFFKLMRNLTLDTNISILSTFLLLCTQGFLSTHAMYFHSGKPMTLVFLAINLYMASIVHQRSSKGESLPPYFYIKWFITLLMSLFWDELFYIYFLITPLIFRKTIFKKEVLIPYLILNASLFAIFSIVVFILLPYYSELFFDYKFNFISEVFHEDSSLHITFEQISYNILSLINSHMNFTKPIMGYYWSYDNHLPYLTFFIFLSLILISLIKKNKINPYLPSLALSLLVFFIFQQCLLTRRGGSLLYGAFYWSCPFSLLFTIWIGLLLNSLRSKLKYLAYPVIALLCLAGYHHSKAALQGHMLGVYNKSNDDRFDHLDVKEKIQRYSYRLVYDVWENKLDSKKVKHLVGDKAINSLWLFYEAELYRYHQNLLKRKN